MDKSFNFKLKEVCQSKNSVLCIGLDIDADRMSNDFSPTLENLESFSKDVVDCTVDFCPVYKINLGFYERYGSAGVSWMERLLVHIQHRSIVIADGKRGDIGNTAKQYAKSLFDTFEFDAATVSPYMGRDSITPFAEYPEKGAFILCLTSNSGSEDFQFLKSGDRYIYQTVADLVKDLNLHNNLGLVVGATHPNRMRELRSRTENLSWLIPGVGAQGGDLASSVNIGNANGTALINVSRGILYSGDSTQDSIRESALKYTKTIQENL